MNIEKIQEVFSNETFLQKLFTLETPAEVQAVLKEQGVEMTEEQIVAIRDMLIKAEQGELPEELLEQVAGGEGWIAVTDPNDPILFQPGFTPTQNP